MAALFAQMWALELAAFLLGAAVTWLVFVRPARAAATRAAQSVPLPPVAVWQARSAHQPEPLRQVWEEQPWLPPTRRRQPPAAWQSASLPRACPIPVSWLGASWDAQRL